MGAAECHRAVASSVAVLPCEKDLPFVGTVNEDSAKEDYQIGFGGIRSTTLNFLRQKKRIE